MTGMNVLIEYLSKVRECTLHIVLVIEAEAAHIYGIGIHVVQLQHSIRPLRSLAQGVSAWTEIASYQGN